MNRLKNRSRTLSECQTCVYYVGLDLGPNCLQRLSGDDKGRHKQGKSYIMFQNMMF